MNDVWKEFEQNPLSHSAAHYLMTVHEIQERKGYARTTDIAHELEISVPSCSQSLKSLLKKGWIEENEDKFFLLTPQGLAQVQLVEKNKEIFLEFFKDFLGVTDHKADSDSCKIEHLISPETSLRFCQFLTLLKSGLPEAKAFREKLKGLSEDICNPEDCKTCPHNDHCNQEA